MLYFESNGYGYSKRLCEDVVCWFVESYLPKHKLDITVNHRGLSRELVTGWANIEDNDYRPRCFLIEVHSRLNQEDYITTLLHELWHVYQWVKGDLKERRTRRLWDGIDYSEADYEDQPWEQEAKSMESILFDEYKTQKA
jgi:hypothetical protein